MRATLTALLPLLKQKRDDTHLVHARQHYAKARKALDELAVGKPGKRLIHPQQIAKALSDQAAADAIFTCDVGLPVVWGARYLAMNGRRRLLGCSGMAPWPTPCPRRSAHKPLIPVGK